MFSARGSLTLGVSLCLGVAVEVGLFVLGLRVSVVTLTSKP